MVFAPMEIGLRKYKREARRGSWWCGIIGSLERRETTFELFGGSVDDGGGDDDKWEESLDSLEFLLVASPFIWFSSDVEAIFSGGAVL